MVALASFRIRWLLPALLALCVAGWSWRAVTAERQFTGSIHIILAQKPLDGEWQLIDEIVARDLDFRASVLDLATGKAVETRFVQRGRTARGQPYLVRLQDRGSADVDLLTGRLVLQLPFEVTLNGKTTVVPVTIGTEQAVSGPDGTVRGRRFTVNGTSASLFLVGSAEGERLVDFLMPIEDIFALRPGQKVEQGVPTVRIVADGVITAIR